MPFITFEGIDQSGKSTQIELLARDLDAAGIPFISVREPGGTALGEKIRELLLGPEHDGMDAWAEALLYAAARAQLVSKVISPALGEGKVVISDRYIDSSLAYQGIARGLGPQTLMEINLTATRGLLPDLTFVFHLDVNQSRERLAARATNEDRIENEPRAFHRSVEEGYSQLEGMYPQRIVGIDAAGSVEDIHLAIVALCRERLEMDL
jgi:dTMP kinase